MITVLHNNLEHLSLTR